MSFIMLLWTSTASAAFPSDITIDNNNFDENAPVGTLVGNLSTVDADLPADSHTYTIQPGLNGAAFNIVGNELRTAFEYDYESLGGVGYQLNVTIRTTDSSSNAYQKVLTINVNDVQEPPETFGASPVFIEEQPAGIDAVDGGIFFQDPDSGDSISSITIQSCIDGNATDCSGLFTVDNSGDFGATATWDFETATTTTFNLVVRGTSTDGSFTDEPVTINLVSIAEPDSITGVDGTYGIGDTVELIITYEGKDIDANDGFGGIPPTLELETGVVDRTAELFIDFVDPDHDGFFDQETIFRYVVQEGDESADLDYTSENAIQVNDGSIVDSNYYYATQNLELPTPGATSLLSAANDIVIDGVRPTISTATGSLVSTNHTTGDTVSFTVDFSEPVNYSGAGDTSISVDVGGTNVVAVIDPSFVLAPSTTTQIPFTFQVTAGMSDPDGIDLTTNTFDFASDVFTDQANNEPTPIGATTTLAHPTINLPNDLVNFVPGPTAPTDIDLSVTSVDENLPVATEVGTFTTTDPTIVDSFTYTLVAGGGDTDNASFNIVGDKLETAETFDFESKNSYSIRVRTTDAGAESFEEQFTITINDIPESTPSKSGSSSTSSTATCTFLCDTDEPTESSDPETDTPVEEPETDNSTPTEEPTTDNETPTEEPTTPETTPVTKPSTEPVVKENPPVIVEIKNEEVTPVTNNSDNDKNLLEAAPEDTEEPSEESDSSRSVVIGCLDLTEAEFSSLTNPTQLDCDPTNEFIEEPSSNEAVIVLNLSKVKTVYPSDRFIITGQVFNSDVSEVDVLVRQPNGNLNLGRVEVDGSGKFYLINTQKLQIDKDIYVYANGVDRSLASPEYPLEISSNYNLIGVELQSFANKPTQRLWEIDDEEVDYRTFVSLNDIKKYGLEARVKSGFKTYHKAYWKSILIGSSAITGSNSDEISLDAPEELLNELTPFSTHRVMIVAENGLENSKSVPVVIEYYVIPGGFVPGILIVMIALGLLTFVVYRRNNKKPAPTEAIETVA